MSFVCSDQISAMYLETSTLGDRITSADFMHYLNRAHQYFSSGYKMPTSERKFDLLTFSGIWEYPLPSDFLGIMPPRRPYGMTSPDFQHQTTRSIVRWPYNKATSISWDRETPYLVINETSGTSLQIQNCESLTDNGTWALTGDGSALTLDGQIYSEGENSLRFTVTASGGTTTLTCPDITSALDITDYLSIGYGFINLQCPSTNSAALTSVVLRIGSDASNYYSMTATKRYRGNTILGGWGHIGFDFSNKTTVLSPDSTAIDYIQIIITHGASGVDGVYRLDDIFLGLPAYYELPYYSLYNIKSSGGTYKENITAVDDTVLCPTEAESAYFYKALEIAAIEKLQDPGLANYYRSELAPKERVIKSKYPSQESLVSRNWYSRSNKF